MTNSINASIGFFSWDSGRILPIYGLKLKTFGGLQSQSLLDILSNPSTTSILEKLGSLHSEKPRADLTDSELPKRVVSLV